MGYERKLYIVNKTSVKFEIEEKQYAEIIAFYNMSKFNAFDGIFTKETDCFIYADDGNTQILKDKYGDALKESTITEVIECLEKFKEAQENYRRVQPLLSLLKGFNLDEWENLVVLHYGY